MTSYRVEVNLRPEGTDDVTSYLVYVDSEARPLEMLESIGDNLSTIIKHIKGEHKLAFVDGYGECFSD